jgi:membrane protein DedA with SNARE-associated domain/membrane-associated phospholipid phosphatase
MHPSSFLPALEHLGVWGYWIVFLLAAAEAVPIAGVFVPGASRIVLAGGAAAHGILEVGDLIWFAAAGAVLGDGLSYYLGVRGKHLFRPGSRWLNPEYLAKGEAFFRRHGDKSVFLGRFVGPIRGIVPFVAGLAAMDKRTFLLWNVLSGVLWAAAHVLAGYLLGNTAQRLGVWTTRAGLFLLALAALGGLLWFLVRASGPVLAFLRSVGRSVADAIATNPDVRALVARHPTLFTFLRGRLEREVFVGLPLTILAVIFALLLFTFGGITEDVVTSDPIVTIDAHLASLLAAYREPVLTKAFLWFTLLAKGQVIVTFALAAGALFIIWRKRFLLAPLTITLLGTEATVQAIKHIILRARPGAELAYYIEKSAAFPSGHAAIAAAFYGFLAYALARDAATWARRTHLAFAAVVVILAVGLSRLYLGVHFLSDVLGGYLVGLLWVVVGTSLAEFLRTRPQTTHVPLRLSALVRLTVTAALVGVAIAFYVAFALHYAPPLATARTPDTTPSSPAVRE